MKLLNIFLNFNGWILGKEKWFHLTFYNVRNYLFMQGLKLKIVSKRGPSKRCVVIWIPLITKLNGITVMSREGSEHLTTRNSNVCSAAGSVWRQKKHQGPHNWAFVRGIHRWPMDSPYKVPVMWKAFSYNDIIMQYLRFVVYGGVFV